MTDLDAAEELTARALDVARAAGDVDLELVALAQLGHIRVGAGDAASGFALLDEAVAAALGGERSTLDTVVYTCCDMLNACELADDLERAAQWCQVADDFVATYGCPFLYAECRIYYGSVLTAKGRWADAERELAIGLRITEGRAPACTPRRWSGWPPCGSVRAGSRTPTSCWRRSARASRQRPKRRCRWRRCCSPAAMPPPQPDTSSISCAGCSGITRCWRERSTCSSTLSWTRGSWTRQVGRRPGWANRRLLPAAIGRWCWRRPRGVGWRWPPVPKEPLSCWTQPARGGPDSACRSRRRGRARRLPGWWPTPSPRLRSTTPAVLWRRSTSSALGSTRTGRRGCCGRSA